MPPETGSCPTQGSRPSPETTRKLTVKSCRTPSSRPDSITAAPPPPVRAWESAVEGTLEGGLPSLGDENALTRYMDHFTFSLNQSQMDQSGLLTQIVHGHAPSTS